MAKPLRFIPPVRPLQVTQRFGENRSCVQKEGAKVVTVADAAECPSGYEPLYTSRNLRGHNGIDFVAAEKQPVYAAHAGRVIATSTETERGTGISIVSGRLYLFSDSDGSATGRYHAKTRYWHLSGCAVKKGDRVRAGQRIGWAGSTGMSSGPHLHFELKPAERVQKGKYRNAFSDNGYAGAINPSPYFEE